MLTPHMSNTLAAFHKSMRTLQTQAVMNIKGKDRGVVLLPTGAGKTRVQVHTILDDLKDRETGVAVIASHRLLLCEQLLLDLLKTANEAGFEYNVLTVASDGVDFEDVSMVVQDCENLYQKLQVKRTTTTDEVREFAKQTKAINRHLLVVCTYQSLDRLGDLRVDVACMDEAHTLVEEDKHNNLLAVLSNIQRCFFFTATPVHECSVAQGASSGRGMNNEDVYGKVLYAATPRMAIDNADILPPAIMSIDLVKGTPTYTNVIQASFRALQEKVLQYGKGNVGTVLLVSVAGIDELVGLVRDLGFHQWATEAGVKVFGFTSGKGYFSNGLEVTRREAIKQLRELDVGDSAIVMHYDILTEGIDLPNISGVLPLRELCELKFLQTIGRAMRLIHTDREALGNNTHASTSVDPNGNLVVATDGAGASILGKPMCWVIKNPLISNNAVQTNKDLVEYIRKALNINPSVRSFPEISVSTTDVDAESLLPPRTPSERNHAATYTVEYEAMVFLASMAPQVEVLSGKGSEAQKKLAAETVSASVDALLGSLPTPPMVQPQEESDGKEEPKPTESDTSDGTPQASQPQIVQEQSQGGGGEGRRTRSKRVIELLGF